MTAVPRPVRLGRQEATTGCLLAGFAAAVWLRAAIGGPEVASSVGAGLAFGAVLVVLTVVAGSPRPHLPPARAVAWGVAGGAVLCVPPLLLGGTLLGGAMLGGTLLGGAGHPPGGPYLPWAAVVGVVAAAEEAFLRGALFDAVLACHRRPDGQAAVAAALAVTSLCFAGLHVPLYGWHAVPLDLAVGLWLGALRHATGHWSAPAVAHVLADLLGWWLR